MEEVAWSNCANRGVVARFQIDVCEMVFRSIVVQSTAGAFSAKNPSSRHRNDRYSSLGSTRWSVEAFPQQIKVCLP